ncbi:recombinase [Leifsonia xyli]|uniref:YqaJ viral recombinase family protein n=1 Tax=Leifsonia xyli TaxID=1575 RepID=UPI0007CE01FD|nr:recombinase [Leifsonia xyli]
MTASVGRTRHNGQVLDSAPYRSADLYRPGVLADLSPARPAPVPVVPAVPGATGHLARVVARSSDRVGWLRARSRGITATDVAKLSSPRAVRAAMYDKLHGNGFSGNVFTQHGRSREPEIAAWVAATHGIQPSELLFHAERDRRHLATPDGLAVRTDDRIELCEIKTTNKPLRSIPRHYLRQIWWQQYVLGAERTLFVWEQHDGFVPLRDEPECRWVDRDEAEIEKLVALAADLIELLRQATSAPTPASRASTTPAPAETAPEPEPTLFSVTPTGMRVSASA